MRLANANSNNKAPAKALPSTPLLKGKKIAALVHRQEDEFLGKGRHGAWPPGG